MFFIVHIMRKFAFIMNELIPSEYSMWAGYFKQGNVKIKDGRQDVLTFRLVEAKIFEWIGTQLDNNINPLLL